MELLYFDILDDETLVEIAEGRFPADPLARKVLAGMDVHTAADLLEADGERDEADCMYWRRRLEGYDVLPDEDFKELLAKPTYSCARRKLGEAAMSGMLTREQISTLLAVFDEPEWARKQFEARHIVNVFEDRDEDGMAWRELDSEPRSLVETLIELRTEWAIRRILPYLYSDEIEWLAPLMNDRKLLTRNSRHHIRQAIRLELKARKE